MSRLSIPAVDDAPEASKPILSAVNSQLGVVPNLFRLIANSPATLEGFAAFSGALKKTLDAKTRERIALAVAQVNGCDYCLSAHSYLATNLANIDGDEILRNRRGSSGDAKASAAVALASEIVQRRGHVSDATLKAARDAGYSDAQVVEIVGVVAENVFTNFLNIVAGTAIDFPVVLATDLLEAA